jgi:hypothetical protein
MRGSARERSWRNVENRADNRVASAGIRTVTSKGWRHCYFSKDCRSSFFWLLGWPSDRKEGKSTQSGYSSLRYKEPRGKYQLPPGSVLRPSGFGNLLTKETFVDRSTNSPKGQRRRHWRLLGLLLALPATLIPGPIGEKALDGLIAGILLGLLILLFSLLR